MKLDFIMLQNEYGPAEQTGRHASGKKQGRKS
jgi:hypothetical protein